LEGKKFFPENQATEENTVEKNTVLTISTRERTLKKRVTNNYIKKGAANNIEDAGEEAVGGRQGMSVGEKGSSVHSSGKACYKGK